MELPRRAGSPASHTPEGGVLLGPQDAGKRLLVFEDPQCPFCRQFEERCGDVLRSAREGGTLAIEYRMRCFLGVESVRADNALALAAEQHRFDELRTELFAAQPPEGTGGFTIPDLLALGRRAGLTSPEYVSGVQDGRYEGWVLDVEEVFQAQDPQGTPAAWLDGQPVDPGVLTQATALRDLLGQPTPS